MKIRRRRVRPRAFIFLLALVVVLGGCIHDKQAQGGTVGQTAQAVQPERTVCGYEESNGGRNPTAGTTGSESSGSDSEAASTRLTTGKLSEHGHNAEIKEPGSLTMSVSRGSAGGLDRRYTDLFNTVGIEFKITAYTAGYESTGKNPGDPDYGITYDGSRVSEGHTIAADLKVLPLGTKIVIEGIDAVFVVEDKGGAVKGKHIDLYIPQLSEAEDWGVQYRKIIVLEMGAKDNE